MNPIRDSAWGNSESGSACAEDVQGHKECSPSRWRYGGTWKVLLAYAITFVTLGLLSGIAAQGATGVGYSGEFAIDLRFLQAPASASSAVSPEFVVNLIGFGAGLPVSGRVYDSATGSGLGGAVVTIGASSVTTDAQGNYLFSAIAMGSYPLSVLKAGYNSYNGTLGVSGGTSVRRDLSLSPSSQSGSPPRVTGITCPYPGFLYFLDGPDFDVTFTATVDWAGHPPSKVEFRTPRVTREVGTSGATASQSFNMGDDFGPKGKLRVVAVSSDATRSAEKVADLIVMPAPSPEVAGALLAVSHNLSGSGFKYNTQQGFNMSFFDEAIGAGVIPEDIPIFGKEGVNLQFIPQMTCEIGSDGVASFKLKWSDFKAGEILEQEWGRNHNLKKIIDLLTQKTDQGLIDQRRLPKTAMAGLELHWYPIAGGQFQFNRATERWEPARFGAGLAGAFDLHKSWPFLIMAGPIPVPTYAKVALEVEAEAQVQLTSLQPAILSGSFGLDPYVRGSLGVGIDEVLAVEGWIGGGLNLDLQYPAEPNFDVAIYLNGGATVYAFLWQWENEFLYWEWPEEKGAPRSRLFSPMTVRSSGPMPVPRDYLKNAGYGRFYSRPTAAGLGRLTTVLDRLSPKIGPLQTTIFPHSEPDCSSSGTNFHLVWLSDDPTRSMMNRAVAQFSRFNGTSWSAPTAVANDGTADFHPEILTFNDGWSVCAWENERIVLPDTASFQSMTTNLEIAVAWWDALKAAWQPMQMLTTNHFLDRSPKLAGRSRDNVLLVWTANATSHITGSATEPNQLLFSRWSGANWSDPRVFMILTNALVKYDLAYDGTNGYLVLSLDAANSYTNVTAHELFRVVYQGGAWGNLERLTTDQLPDDNPQMAYDENGTLVLVWLKGDELSSVADFALSERWLIRTNLYSSNLGDAKLASSRDGKLALLWAEPSEFSSDLYAVFYDPIFGLWGDPKRLTADAETERGLTAAFRGTDELIAVYNRLMIGPTSNSTNTDLYVLEYNLGEDVAIKRLICQPPNPAPGETATFEVRISNQGDQVVANLSVAFYQGDPAEGGTEIGRTEVTDPLAPGGETNVVYSWTLPETGQPVAFHAVVDPDHILVDLVRSNNVLGLEISKADVAIQSVTWGLIASNKVSITARVGNQGVISSQAGVVEFRLGSPAGTNLSSVTITNLAPGEAVDVAFVWDVTGLSDSQDIHVIVEGDASVGDFDPANNAARLVLQLAGVMSPLELGPVLRLPGGTFQITVSGEAGRTYRIETSTNLLDWLPFMDFFTTNGTINLIDPATNLDQRFYRGVLP
jgi:hypothetical protein